MILIGDVVEILSGYAFKSNLFNESGEGLPLVRIRDVGKQKSETYYSGEYSDAYLLKNGDFIIGMDGDFRLAKWEGGKALLNQRVCKITPNKEKIDPSYLFYILPKELKKIEDVTSFATVKHLSAKDIKAISIPLPPLAEQQKIAAILDAADSLRQKDQQLVERYTALSQSLFLEMFGDPVTNPMGWNKITLEEAINKGFILDIQDGNHGEKHPKVSDFKDNGLPFIMANCLRDGEVDLSKSYKLHSDWLKILRVGFARAGDVLLSHKGTVGEVAVIPESVESVILSPQVTYYRTSVELDANFLATQFACASYQQLLDKEAKQSTRAYIGITRQKQLSIIIPPIALQINFFEYLKNIKSQKEQAKSSLQKSEALFNSLLQRAFTGELTAKKAA